MEQLENLISNLRRKGGYVIYGAGVIAYGAFEAIRELYGISPMYFVVTKREPGLRQYGGIPVLEIEEIGVNETGFQASVLVAVPEIYHGEIRSRLSEKGIEGACFLDDHREYLLMSRYFRKKGILVLMEDLKAAEGGEIASEELLAVYMAKSHRDKKLTKDYPVPPWVIPVQAGKRCTEQVVAPVSDAEGENISARNPDYCELTVTFWAWKNAKKRYKGICHYRRIFILNTEDIERIRDNDIDLVMPLPFVCYPTAAGQYGRYISPEDRQALEWAIRDISPEDLRILREIDGQSLYYDYNMMIAKENVFDDYAAWMFPILFQAEKYCMSNRQIRGDRYAGYLGELLTTMYVFKNRDRYRIVHAEKDWMV